MNDIFLVFADYLKGKSVYPAVRRCFNLLFNISIASFIFEQHYGLYTWLNYNDYKGILNFFIKGGFFIPFSIFLAVYAITQFLAVISFSIINHFRTLKLTREIISYQVKKEVVDDGLQEITNVSKYITPAPITKEMILGLYNLLKKELTPEAYQQMEKELKEPKDNLEADFIMVFRALIATTIYFFSIPLFGWKLFIIAFVVMLVALYIIMLAYRLLDVLPALIRKFHFSAEKYLEEHNNEQAHQIKS